MREADRSIQSLEARVAERLHAWNVVSESRLETQSSVILHGTSSGQPVVVKVVKRVGDDEWQSGAVVHSFGGRGMVRARDFVDGAVLLERLEPGYSLESVLDDLGDDGATTVLGDVIAAFSPDSMTGSVPTARTLGEAFRRLEAGGQNALPRDLVQASRETYEMLCDTEANPRLLHGDLQHFNVLFDARRGWIAIDPKGLMGEPEYEIGAMLRNPGDRPELFATRRVVERRVSRIATRLGLDADRIVAWAFAQSVLSAVWAWEDGSPDPLAHSSLQLAGVLRPMMGSAMRAGRR
jgi:streptomycin 6-kinase